MSPGSAGAGKVPDIEPSAAIAPLPPASAAPSSITANGSPGVKPVPRIATVVEPLFR